MTVIEARGRGGQLLGRIHCRGLEITVGRAFDNDVILEDPFVSPHHLKLTKIGEGWQVDDLDSLNGVRLDASGGSTKSLRSGDHLRIGHTVLHLYEESHPVDAALELGDAEARFSMLGRYTVWPVLVAISALVSVVTGYWGSVTEFKPLAMVQSVLEGVLAVVLIAAFWALMGRLLRHRAYFLAHLSIWLAFGVLLKAVTFVAQWFGYNANSLDVEDTLGMLFEFCVGAYALWGSLVLATNLHGRIRLASALGAAFGLLSISLATELQFDREFSPRPKYYARLERPELLWARPAKESVLLDALGPLFDEADAKIAEEEEEARKDREVGDAAAHEADHADVADGDKPGADPDRLTP